MAIVSGSQRDPFRSRWMLFIDGENLAIRAKALAEKGGLALKAGPHYMEDVFVWLPGVTARNNLYGLDGEAIRAYYYTSVTGAEDKISIVKDQLWSLGFTPEVFKKTKKDQKAKGVDLTIARDLLNHGFHDHYNAAVLVAGDGDYVPLVSEIKRMGKLVYVAFFAKEGLNEELKRVSDGFIDFTDPFTFRWTIRA